jgi:hypothetical protein
MNGVFVYGSSALGQVVRALIGNCGREFAGFIDDWNNDPEVVGTLDTLLSSPLAGGFEIAMAIGYRQLDARLALYCRLKTAELRFCSLIHPAAYVATGARVEEGAVVMARATVDVEAAIGPVAVPGDGRARAGTCSLLGPRKGAILSATFTIDYPAQGTWSQSLPNDLFVAARPSFEISCAAGTGSARAACSGWRSVRCEVTWRYRSGHRLSIDEFAHKDRSGSSVCST